MEEKDKEEEERVSEKPSLHYGREKLKWAREDEIIKMVEKGRKNREKPPCATDKKLQNATNKHLLFLLNK
jgi:hypothetical protein